MTNGAGQQVAEEAASREIVAAAPHLDVITPNVARMYDYYLGGKDNFPADREAAERAIALNPYARDCALANRAFVGRVVRHLVAEDVRQFLDAGTGGA
jgi:hypothetical protein